MDQVSRCAPVLVDVKDAQRTFSELLDRVEQGETFVVTRDGMAVARLIAGAGHNVEKARQAVERLTALRKELAAGGVCLSQEEIRAMRDEGRR
jgi:prevent-host-death family protein